MKYILITIILLSTVLQAQKIDDAFIDEYVKESNKVFPTRVNKYTVVGNLLREGRVLTFSMITTLKINQKEINKRKFIYDNEWCQTDFMKNKLLKNGYTIVMSFYNEDNFNMGANMTTYQDCQNNELYNKYLNFFLQLSDDEIIRSDTKEFKELLKKAIRKRFREIEL